MKKLPCKTCSERNRCRDSSVSWLFFIVGLIATIAMRVVTVLMHMDPVYGKGAWYIGVFGFFIFFLYKFNVNQQRSKLIIQQDLVRKINQKEQLAPQDYQLIGNLLCSLSSKKERINYFFIFGLSAVALAIAVYIDFFKQ